MDEYELVERLQALYKFAADKQEEYERRANASIYPHERERLNAQFLAYEETRWYIHRNFPESHETLPDEETSET